MMCKGECVKSRVSACALGGAIGLTKGLYLMLFAWAAALWGVGVPYVAHLATFYSGYAATFVGGLLGGLHGLIIGFIFGFFIGVFYNWCLCCGRCCCKKDKTTPTM